MTACVLVVESLDAHLRGYVGRFLSELSTGVYIGNLSGRVSDKLWETLCGEATSGWYILVRFDNSFAGCSILIHNHKNLTTKNFDGLLLPLTKQPFIELINQEN